tara:strand:- start:378 stop:551 length:174 start_codon:yes stop_codon:yes gene_type:complete
MARKDPIRKLTAQTEKSSKCIQKYSGESANKDQIVAKCLDMARRRRLTDGGAYIKKK